LRHVLALSGLSYWINLKSKIFNLQSFLLYALPVLSLSKDATSLSRLSPFDPFTSSPKQAEVRITKTQFC
jgi:hypothetical protein